MIGGGALRAFYMLKMTVYKAVSFIEQLLKPLQALQRVDESVLHLLACSLLLFIGHRRFPLAATVAACRHLSFPFPSLHTLK